MADEAKGAAASEPWRARWRRWRDRILARPGFQRWALRFPLTRPIARRQARALFDLCAGFVYSQILYACVRLDLLRALAQGPAPADSLAATRTLSAAEMRRLLDAAAGVELVEHRGDGLYGLGPLGAALLGNPAIASMVEHHHLLYSDLQDPLALLRGEIGQPRLSAYWAYARSEAPTELGTDEVAPYTGLMAASQAFIADQVLEAVPFERYRHLLDVGGGDASFAIAAMKRHPALRATVHDLPAVAGAGERRIAEAGLAQRGSAIGGDFLTDPLPGGADVVTLIRVLHDHDDAAAQALLERVRAAMPSGAELVVAEPMATARGDAARVSAYFGLYLLAMGQGRPRSPEELAAMVRNAGFERPRLARSSWPMLVRVMRANVP